MQTSSSRGKRIYGWATSKCRSGKTFAVTTAKTYSVVYGCNTAAGQRTGRRVGVANAPKLGETLGDQSRRPLASSCFLICQPCSRNTIWALLLRRSSENLSATTRRLYSSSQVSGRGEDLVDRTRRDRDRFPQAAKQNSSCNGSNPCGI